LVDAFEIAPSFLLKNSLTFKSTRWQRKLSCIFCFRSHLNKIQRHFKFFSIFFSLQTPFMKLSISAKYYIYIFKRLKVQKSNLFLPLCFN
jgi:hypothetical protein